MTKLQGAWGLYRIPQGSTTSFSFTGTSITLHFHCTQWHWGCKGLAKWYDGQSISNQEASGRKENGFSCMSFSLWSNHCNYKWWFWSGRVLVIKVSQYLLVMLWLRLTCTTVLQNWLLAITCDQDFKFLWSCVNAVLWPYIRTLLSSEV